MDNPAQTGFQWIKIPLLIRWTCLDSASSTNKPFLCRILSAALLLSVQILRLWSNHLITTLFFQLCSLKCLSFSFNFLVFSSILIFSNFLQLVSFLLGLHTPVQSWIFQEQLWQCQIQQRAPTSWEVFWTLRSSAHWTFTSLGVLRSHDAVTWPVITCSSYHLLAGHRLFFSVNCTPPAKPAVKCQIPSCLCTVFPPVSL